MRVRSPLAPTTSGAWFKGVGVRSEEVGMRRANVRGVQGIKRFLLVIALALGLLAASALPAIADEHVAKSSNWWHDGTRVYTTTAVNQHDQYGDLQGILKFRQRSAPNTGNFDIQIDYVRLYRVLPHRADLLMVGENTNKNLLVTGTWAYVNSGWQRCGPNLPIGRYYAVSRFQIIHNHNVGTYVSSGWRVVRTAKWHYDGHCF
jgi:hypothetical protein